jgi:ATP-dependent DNA helicase RecQ
MDSSERTLRRLRQIGRDVLDFAAVRPAQQQAAAALACGRGRLAVLPSAAGKAAIYQIAAAALVGPAIAVSALPALQRDQAGALRARRLAAVTVNALSGQSARDDADALLG